MSNNRPHETKHSRQPYYPAWERLGLVERNDRLSNLSPQFQGQQRRRHRGPERNHRKLDYLHGLGIETLWLNPIFASPNADNGYDISDYRQIMPDFGTMEDFDRLLNEAHARGMRLLLDLVLNHTSDQHPWFREARTSRENPYYDYYLWWPEEQGRPPYRKSHFDEEGDAWCYNAPTRSYYLHYFARQQPDLNWQNPEVRAEIYDILRFWLDKGSMDSGWIRFHTLQKTRRFRRSTSASTRTCSPTTRSGRTCTTTCTK